MHIESQLNTVDFICLSSHTRICAQTYFAHTYIHAYVQVQTNRTGSKHLLNIQHESYSAQALSYLSKIHTVFLINTEAFS